MGLLETYGGPRARINLMAQYPQLKPMIDVTTALLQDQAAGQFDNVQYRLAGNITLAFRLVLGAIEDTIGEILPVDEAIALSRLKRGVRDASLTFPWPYTPPGDGGHTIVLNTVAQTALANILLYDPLRNFDAITGVYYVGKTNNLYGMLGDVLALATGISIKKS
jgi:hypothetical protein